MLRWVLGVFLVGVGATHGAEAARITGTSPPPPAPPAVFLLRGGGSPIPVVASPEQPLDLVPGDIVFTRDGGGALGNMADGKPIRLGENCRVEIPETGWLSILRGAVFFFSSRLPAPFHLRTPHVVGGSLNTEFEVRVNDHETIVTLFEGRLGVTNDVDSVVLVTDAPGAAQRVAATRTNALRPELLVTNVVQWWLPYPAVLDAAGLAFPRTIPAEVEAARNAYAAGDLNAARRLHAERAPGTDPERLFAAALRLVVGDTAGAERHLRDTDPGSSESRALRLLVAVVTGARATPKTPPESASEWLALSYFRQAHHELTNALNAATAATDLSPRFGFAWVRSAELHLALGDRRAARCALEQAARWTPRHAQAAAMRGFLAAAENRPHEAAQAFEQALSLDPALADGWLGRGLMALRRRHPADGIAALQTATSLQPNRSVARSYLGKAFQFQGDPTNAWKEFELAQQLDPADPTPWLYQGLVRFEELRFNEAITNLLAAIERNGNRRLFRSRQLLDADQATRRANLARIYREVGMEDWSAWEAARAVNDDYTGYAAHLFLANSYGSLLDPNRVQLRYETAAASEYLIASLLSPVGGTRLSQLADRTAVWDEFQVDRAGWTTETVARTTPAFEQSLSHYGHFGRTAYSLDAAYTWLSDHDSDLDAENRSLSLSLKQQVGPYDDLFLLAQVADFQSDQETASWTPQQSRATVSVDESQVPNVFLGHHREWQPGLHSLLLLGGITDDFRLRDPSALVPITETNGAGQVVYVFPGRDAHYTSAFDQGLFSRYRAFTGEAQVILERDFGTVLAGVRGQSGSVDTTSVLSRYPGDAPVIFADPAAAQALTSSVNRVAGYLYGMVRVLPQLQLQVGLTYDWLSYPRNPDLPPVAAGETTTEQVSPKVGLVWEVGPKTALRAAYTRSLGGLFQESSLRLEPVQVAGFLQAYRSLIPETLAGSVPGASFDTLGLAWNQRFGTSTYLTVSGEALQSTVDRQQGSFVDDEGGLSAAVAVPGQLDESLRFRETTLTAQVNHLAGSRWAFGLGYRLEHARFESDLPALRFAAPDRASVDTEAILHQVAAQALYNDPTGFFGQVLGSVSWYDRDEGFAPAGSGTLPRLDVVAGFRFARGRCEIAVAGRNLTDEDFVTGRTGGGTFVPWRRTGELRLTLNF